MNFSINFLFASTTKRVLQLVTSEQHIHVHALLVTDCSLIVNPMKNNICYRMLLITKTSNISSNNCLLKTLSTCQLDHTLFKHNDSLGGLRHPSATYTPLIVLLRANGNYLDTSVLGFTIWWIRVRDDSGDGLDTGTRGEEERKLEAGGEATGVTLRGLSCGASYSVRAVAHSRAGPSPPSAPLLVKTKPPG